jgi:hypothetical protein
MKNSFIIALDLNAKAKTRVVAYACTGGGDLLLLWQVKST